MFVGNFMACYSSFRFCYYAVCLQNALLPSPWERRVKNNSHCFLLFFSHFTTLLRYHIVNRHSQRQEEEKCPSLFHREWRQLNYDVMRNHLSTVNISPASPRSLLCAYKNFSFDLIFRKQIQFIMDHIPRIFSIHPAAPQKPPAISTTDGPFVSCELRNLFLFPQTN